MTQAGDYVMPMGEATDFSRALVIEVSGFSWHIEESMDLNLISGELSAGLLLKWHSV